jgi:hypothetical protein
VLVPSYRLSAELQCFQIVYEANGSGELFFPFFFVLRGMGAIPLFSLELRSAKKSFLIYVFFKTEK